MQKLKNEVLIIFLVCLFLFSCSKTNPVNPGYGFYSTTVTLSAPADNASFPYGNVTFTWRKPVADNVLYYSIMINGILYNVQDTIYTHNFQPPAGTFEWMVYASVVDTNSTFIISSEKRHVTIHQ